MAKLDFFPGQRWVSNTESELGLGRILSYSNRRVEIEFPAVEETRTYAAESAPLSRIQFSEGDVVQDEIGDDFVVVSGVEHQNCFIYQCMNDAGEATVLPEQHLGSAVHFVKPQQRLFAGQIDRQSYYKLRVKTLNHLNRLDRSEVRGLLGARVDLLPHQLHVAQSLGQIDNPRALLADEVGLGKTIEAGLIIHQRLITGRSSRVLIVLPENLQHQWLVEMLRRFNLSFSLFDEERIDALIEAGEPNPFESSQRVICGISLLTQQADYLEMALEAGWDLMVVDEAHHIGWSDEQPSHAYLCVERLCQIIPSVLLLTATPEHLGPEGHFARLKLLNPQRFNSLADYLQERVEYRELTQQVMDIEAAGSEHLHEQPELIAVLTAHLGKALVDQYLDAQQEEEKDQAYSRLLETLVATRGPGRMMFRNTRSNLTAFPERILHAYWLDAPPEYLAAINNAPLSDLISPEQVLGEAWLAIDPRVKWLETWLSTNKKRKALLICASSQTAMQLESHLNLRLGVRSASFHEEMSLINRDRAAAYFADPELGAQILVCSEIGSEGRNFQFASDLILFDLPANPDLLEQRIGRLDRIGQQKDVCIHHPCFKESPGAVLFEWLHKGVNAFESVSKVGDALYQQFALPLSELMHQPDSAGLEKLINETQSVRVELEQALAKGRDRLLELNSEPTETDADIVDLMLEAEAVDELKGYAEKLFDRFGLEMQPHGPNGWIIRPGEEMIAPLTTLNDEGMTLTFDREEALQREDIAYMSWEHPLIIELMEWISSSEFGNTALCTFSLPPLPAGTVLLEMHYRAYFSAPKAWQLDRYIDQPVVRFLIDSDGRDLSPLLQHESLNQLAKTLSSGASQKMVRMIRDVLESQIKKLDGLANDLLPELREKARTKYKTMLQQKVAQLDVMVSRGSTEAAAELEQLNAVFSKQVEALERVELVPDSLRVIVTGE